MKLTELKKELATVINNQNMPIGSRAWFIRQEQVDKDLIKFISMREEKAFEKGIVIQRLECQNVIKDIKETIVERFDKMKVAEDVKDIENGLTAYDDNLLGTTKANVRNNTIEDAKKIVRGK